MHDMTNYQTRNPVASRSKALLLLAGWLVLVLAVAPNLAQDYRQLGTSDSVPEVVETDETAGEGNDEGEVSYDQALISDWQESEANVLGDKLSRLVQSIPDYPSDLARVLSRATTPDAGQTALRVVLNILILSVIGLVLEQTTIRKLLSRLYDYAEKQEKTLSLKLRYILIRVMVQLTGVAVLALLMFVAILYTRHGNPYYELLATEWLKALVMLRLWMVLLRNIFSPYWNRLRPIPLDNESSRQLYFWFSGFFFVLEFGDGLLIYLQRAGMSEVQVLGLLIPYTLALNAIVISRFWVMRHKITTMFVSADANNGTMRLAAGFLQTFWPFILIAWLLILWILWLYKAFLGHWEEAEFLSASWWITLAFLGADRVFHRLISYVSAIQWLHSPTFEKRANRFIRNVQSGFRLLMISMAVCLFSLSWGVSPNALIEGGVASLLLLQVINLLIIATVAYIVWEFFNALIERKLPAETENAAFATLEGEGGGIGGTREETLLPLMRSLLSAVLFTFVLLSVLHSLGIAITPLLAGAGVVGIAIGFGAQKLVQDVLSGIFFLIDDAFRKNEYIEIEELRGTVEKISLRSMQLRHHLGPVQTIPYGEIRTVRNLSRDWVTMKLELRLPYDTDIEKVRKTIKKVGQDMLQHPDMGPKFILPLKSQGVLRMEESALILRMKFTAIPGEQWVIRREAYRNVRDALAAEGIHFAHREVRVRLPDDQVSHANPDAVREALKQGAAAAESIQPTAEQAKAEEKPDTGDDR